MNHQPLTTTEKRILIADMIRGNRKAKRHIRFKDSIVEVCDELSPQMIVRLLQLDTRLAALEKKEQAQQQVEPASVQPEAAPTTPSAEETATPPTAKTTKPGKPQKQETYKEMLRRKNRERMEAKRQAAGKSAA